MAVSELDLLSRLDTELVSLVDHFTTLVKAARPPEEDATQQGREGRDKRPPGEMLEVLGERMLLSAHTCVHLTSELKKGAMLSDFDALIAALRSMRERVQPVADAANTELRRIKAGVQVLLNELEASYYASQHRGPLPPNEPSSELRELCQLASQAAQGGGDTSGLTAGPS